MFEKPMDLIEQRRNSLDLIDNDPRAARERAQLRGESPRIEQERVMEVFICWGNFLDAATNRASIRGRASSRNISHCEYNVL